jgi:hypothetical protein
VPDHHHATTGSPDRVADHDATSVETETQDVSSDRFDGLRARFDGVDATVQVLLRADDAVLLETFDGANGWHPPGGELVPSESVADGASRVIENLTGLAIRVDHPVSVTRTTFREADGDRSFTNPSVTIAASPVDATNTSEHPLRPDPTHDVHPDPATVDLRLDWFETIPDDVNPNHRKTIEAVL